MAEEDLKLDGWTCKSNKCNGCDDKFQVSFSSSLPLPHSSSSLSLSLFLLPPLPHLALTPSFFMLCPFVVADTAQAPLPWLWEKLLRSLHSFPSQNVRHLR